MGDYCNLAFHDDFVKPIAFIMFIDYRGVVMKYNVCEKCYHSLMDRITHFNFFIIMEKWLIWGVS